MEDYATDRKETRTNSTLGQSTCGIINQYLAMVLSFNFDIPGLLFSVAIMLALGFGIVQTGNMHMCLYFFLHGYHVLSLDNVRILTKFSMEEYLLKLEENPNGLEARELTKRVYIIFPTN